MVYGWWMSALPTEYDLERPWERQPFDTEKRWRAFVAYREQRLPRTIRGAHETLEEAYDEGLVDNRPHTSLLQTWSGENAWPERCLEYDRHLDRHRVQATIDILNEDARTVAAHHIGILRDAQTAAASVVRQWLKKLAAGEPLEGWAPNDVRGMLKDCMTLERLVRGQATERVEHGIVDLGALTLDEIETLRMLEAKAGVLE